MTRTDKETIEPPKDGVLMAEGVTIERATSIEDAVRMAARIAPKGNKGDVHVLILRKGVVLKGEDMTTHVKMAEES